MISIRPSNNNDLTKETVTRLTDLVNVVYAESEGDLWKPGVANRTNKEEISNFIKQNNLLIAEYNSTIVGMCKVVALDNEICEFGMLAADPEQRGIGIGRELVNAAEKWGKENGHKKMRLELLTPRFGKSASKEFLKVWYGRRGYVPSYSMPFEEEFGHRMNDFAVECDFTVWLKKL